MDDETSSPTFPSAQIHHYASKLLIGSSYCAGGPKALDELFLLSTWWLFFVFQA